MFKARIHVDRMGWTRFFRAIRVFVTSEVGWRAKGLFFVLLVLLFGISGMNVANSYVGRNFMTAIADRNRAEFIWQAVLYIGVFAGSTLVAVISRFAEERLGLLWRAFLTRRMVTFYLAQGTYYRLEQTGEIANPDQRIAEDAKAFTVTTLSFILMLLNSGLTVMAFSGVLWSISPKLFIVAVLYAALGSFLTIVLGRPLVKLNIEQLDREADFRSALLHVRENAEPVMLARHETQLSYRLLHRLDVLVGNFRRVITINLNLGFFTTGYSWMIQIIPALVVAPQFISGEVEFGVVTQSAMAFTMLVGAFSFIVNQFQSISSFAAVSARLSSLAEAFEKPSSEEHSIEIREEERSVLYERLTLVSHEEGLPLLKELSVSIAAGRRVLILSEADAPKAALFRATAGIWNKGEGRIARPGARNIFFLAERPYVPPGTLREILGLRKEQAVSEGEVLGVLQGLCLDTVIARAGGLDGEHEWSATLSLSEQKLLAFARILLARPQFAFLERPGTSMSPDQVKHVLGLLSDRGIGYLLIGEAADPLEFYDAVLEIAEGGTWRWKELSDDLAGKAGLGPVGKKIRIQD
jgi:vitamin B12/bleomycin/antimicrobial peptide transport system ATP-binding/permease protein